MSIRPHPTHAGWFYVDHYPNGSKGKRERVPFSSYAEAAQYEKRVNPTAAPITTHPRLSDAVPGYLDWVKEYQSESTYTSKERRFRRWILPALGHYRVKQLTQTILDDYRKGTTASQFALDVAHLSALIGWMVKRNMADPLKFKPQAPMSPRKIKMIPDPPDIKRFIEAVPVDMHRVVCWLMLYSGLRFAEAQRLKWDVYTGDTILCADTKGHQPFQQPIPEPLQEWFKMNRQDAGYVFSVNKGRRPICNITKSLAKAKELTGIYMTAHTFRHASATFLYEMTSDIYAVQQHLRHSKPSTSQIYTRYSAARRRKALNTVIDYMDNSETAKNV